MRDAYYLFEKVIPPTSPTSVAEKRPACIMQHAGRTRVIIYRGAELIDDLNELDRRFEIFLATQAQPATARRYIEVHLRCCCRFLQHKICEGDRGRYYRHCIRSIS